MSAGPGGEKEYILGTNRTELDRLRAQHAVWLEPAMRIWDRAGFRVGHRLLDLGSGPGYTSLDLAARVGPAGHIVATDRSARFLSFLESECARLEVAHVSTSLGDVEALELPEASLDGAYARWLFCWLPNPGAALAAVARALRPGGVVAIQDYLDWGTMSAIPQSPPLERVVAACLRSFAEDEGTIDICRSLPSLAASLGLQVEHFQPVARIGLIGAPGVWTWLSGFYESYLPRLVERGLLSAEDHREWVDEMGRLAAEGASFVQAPTVADLVLRKS